ncbi:hypothetical protein CcaverHIS631_0301310 [Cutaneotrichosporon cavernicola]|nr:hypothetical protein CcaverHIS631_0301310 [Cutaneotrichosporon cavernicola]
MRITALVPLVALLSGAIAAPLPEVVDLAPPPTPSSGHGAVVSSAGAVLTAFRTLRPPSRRLTRPRRPWTPPRQRPTTLLLRLANHLPRPANPPHRCRRATSRRPPPSGLPPGCLTENFCPDTDGGQGGDPGNGDGTITYPNGTKPNGNDNRNRRDVEERSADLTPFLE